MNQEESSFLTDSSWGRPLGVLFSPGATFRSLRRTPTWVVPLVVLCLLATGVQILATGKIDMRQAIEQQMSARGQEMSPEQLDRAVDMQSKFGLGCGVVMPVVFYLVVALLFMVLLNLLGGELSYKGSLAVTVHALMPLAISAILTAVVIASRDSVDPQALQQGTLLASNLGAFAPQGATAIVVALLASVDVFSIWCLVLLVLGFSEMAQVSRGTATAVAVGLWALGIAIKIGFVALGAIGGG